MEPTSLTSQEELAAIIRTAINNSARVIAIDGMDGLGKTTLSTSLAATIGCRMLHLDDFVQKNQDGFYVDFIDYETLGQALETAMSAPGSVLVEGVCVLAILDRLGVSPDLHVYVKELMFGYLWHHKDKLYGTAGTLEEKLAQEDEQNRLSAELEPDAEGLAPDQLRRDLIRYHWHFHPDKNADIVFGITKLE